MFLLLCTRKSLEAAMRAWEMITARTEGSHSEYQRESSVPEAAGFGLHVAFDPV